MPLFVAVKEILTVV